MTELFGYTFETLRKDSEFVLYRGRKPGGTPVLVRALISGGQPMASLRQLERELSFKDELESGWAVRPLAMTRYDGRPALVLEDCGGNVLERSVGQPLGLVRFLTIAIGLAATLRQVHLHGLIHGDIKPANVLVDEGEHVRLTGFGIASRIPRGRHGPDPPEAVVGTLCYMSPEQTGRMNRSVDARSDLYSLGITFFEMLTGVLPFTATDPMEWIHCHVARKPPSPSDLVESIPEAVAAIVLKLLAKAPEDRYQTAAGIEADLRSCLTALEMHYGVDPFPLGLKDRVDRLLVSEKLYGRDAETGALISAFDGVSAQGDIELVLVSGPTGVGKSSLANGLPKLMGAGRGLFAAGKNDQYKRNIPYATLAHAFQALVRGLLGKDEVELGHWRQALLDAIGPNGRLMINLIPELSLIIGEQPPVPDLSPQDAQNRFQMVLLRFIGVFARPQHPLALFLDDLQWMDIATLKLLERLVTDSDVRSLLLVCAFRDNQVGLLHPLTGMLEAIRNAGCRVREIKLGPLMLDGVSQLIADALQTERARVSPLADLIIETTGGNPFFAIQYVTALAEEGLLTLDQDNSGWQLDIDLIRATRNAETVSDLMARKLARLSVPSLEALKQLACLGNSASTDTLRMIVGISENEIHAALLEAERASLVRCVDGTYTFLHDRIREAIYELIGEKARAAGHLRIGRALASRTTPSDLGENIFEIVNQFDRGIQLMDSHAERAQVAEFNLVAGKRAKISTAFASAMAYFAAGRALLQEDNWERQYRLTFDLELQLAECEFLNGNLKEAEERLLVLSRHAKNLIDLANVVCVGAQLHHSASTYDRAVEMCLGYLQRVGISWSLHPTDQEVRQEYQRMWSGIAGRSIEALIDLPTMTDPGHRATMDVLTTLLLSAYRIDENLIGVVLGRMTNISLEHGNCDGSTVAYLMHNLILGPHFGDYRSGVSFGKLGLDLVEQRGLKQFKARVYSLFGGQIAPWSVPLRDALTLHRRACDAALEAGDFSYAAFSYNVVVLTRLACGDSLQEVELEAETGLRFAQKARFALGVDLIVTEIRLIRALRGLTSGLASFNDDEFDEHQFEHHLEGNRQLTLATFWYWVRKLQTCFISLDCASALAAATKAQAVLQSISFIGAAEYHFFCALAHAACYQFGTAEAGSKDFEAIVDHQRQLVTRAENCPGTLADRVALIGAEVARLEGRELDAMRLYDEAIRLARELGFIQNEAISNEIAARFYAVRGFETIADTYLRNGRSCYLRWGADGKVRQLEEHHPELRELSPPLAPTTTIGAPIGHLDLDIGTMFKASQALSSEMLPGRLIEKLMRITVEHAGAERCVMILLRKNEPQIAAEAIIRCGKVEVTLHEKTVSNRDILLSALSHVIQKRASLIMDDATTSPSFSNEKYVLTRRPKSVLCIPIVKQAALIGALYLENNLTPGAFTPGRIAVLEFLASQAAISLENAYLYSDLLRSEAFLSEGQRISHTGSWSWSLPTGELTWSEEHCRIFDYDPMRDKELTYPFLLKRVHPDDRLILQQKLDDAIRHGAGFAFDFRIVLPNGLVKYVHGMGRPIIKEDGEIQEYVGTTLDISERKHSEEALRDAQAELVHFARLTTMGELAASIAHEVNQPLMAIVTNAETCLRWLARTKPDISEARSAAERVIRNGHRAGEIIKSIRDSALKSPAQLAEVDINEVIRNTLELMRSEFVRHQVLLETSLLDDLQTILGDRVQLQQVVVNLVMNGIEAMISLKQSRRVLRIGTQFDQDSNVLVVVEDFGVGIESVNVDRIFDPLYTTKRDGLGMGLSICRSIVEAHSGRLWASPRRPFGASFQFMLPVARRRRSIAAFS